MKIITALDFEPLTEIERRYASLKYEHGLTVNEIADRMGRAVSTVRQGLASAEFKMRLSPTDRTFYRFVPDAGFDYEIIW